MPRNKKPWSKPCHRRIARNEHGENMCGAIGCESVGDMPCCASEKNCAQCGDGKGGKK